MWVKRDTKKNIYKINGHPLIAYTIFAAKQSKFITDVVVSTDCEEIKKVANNYGADTPFLRPNDLAGDRVLSGDSLNHTVLESENFYNKVYDYIVKLPCV